MKTKAQKLVTKYMTTFSIKTVMFDGDTLRPERINPSQAAIIADYLHRGYIIDHTGFITKK